MGILFKDSSNIKVGYFGKLGFLVNQAAFSEVFGDNPIILYTNVTTSQDSKSTDRILYSFGEKCKLDVFLHMCKKYYVVHNSVDNSLRFEDLYGQIS